MSQDQEQQSSMEGAKPDGIGGAAAGERLKNARLVLGLSVGDVSTRLKLSGKKIESLERGDIHNIAAPVFVAGYLRAYARLLELPEDDVLVDFEVLSSEGISSENIVESAEIESAGAKSSGVIFTGQPSKSLGNMFRNSDSLLMPFVLSVLVIAVVYFLLQADEPLKDIRVAAVTSSESDAGSIEVAEITPMAGASENSPSLVDAAPSEDEASTVEVAPLAEIPMLPQHETPVVNETLITAPAHDAEQNMIANNGTETASTQQSELALVFNNESWAEVTDARGERLVYRLAKTGMSHTVTGVAPFTVQLGFVPGVEIFYNGVPYDLSRFAGRRSARFRVGNTNDSTASGQAAMQSN